MIVIVAGTRPEFLKLGPCSAALNISHIPHIFLATGQHTSLLEGGPAATDLADAEHLGIRTTGEIIRWPEYAMPVITEALTHHKASLVVVQGDTMSAVVGARAASQLGIPVAHVEAGIRSGDTQDPWPEELFRREITQLASWHFAPTACAYDNLISEGVSPDTIFLTGNPVISAIERYADVVPVPIPDMVVLFTMHRREWLLGGIKPVLEGFLESALRYPEMEIVWPVHPGVAKVLPTSWVQRLPSHVRLIEPMPYRPTIRLLAKALGVCTDSGGLQEEAAYLGTPCAVVRRRTDRPESVDAGVARLFDPTEEGVQAAFTALRERSILRKPTDLYGLPSAAMKIAVGLGVILRQGVRTATKSSIATT